MWAAFSCRVHVLMTPSKNYMTKQRDRAPRAADFLRRSHPLGGTVCWAECWSSRTETSGRPRPVSSSWPSPERVGTPRNSAASTGAGLAPSPARPLPLNLKKEKKTNKQRPNKCAQNLQIALKGNEADVDTNLVTETT